MGRDKSIRLTKNDRKQYSRLARNTKAKIKRTFKNYGVDLTEQIEIPNIESFKTRKEFNEWKEKQKSFTNRSNLHFQFEKNKYGVVATKDEIHKAKRLTKLVQKRVEELNKKANDLPLIVEGKVMGTVEGRKFLVGENFEARRTGIHKPHDFNFNNYESRKRFEKSLERLDDKSQTDYYDRRLDAMRENYTKLLYETFNSDADSIVRKIQSLTPNEYYDLTQMFDVFDFDYPYDEEQQADLLERMHSAFEMYQNMAHDLIDFPPK